jgi:hypothetical protein
MHTAQSHPASGETRGSRRRDRSGSRWTLGLAGVALLVVAVVMMASSAPPSRAQTVHPQLAPTRLARLARLQTMHEDPRIKAGLDIDGTLEYTENLTGKHLSPVALPGLNRPFMLMGSPGTDRNNEPSWKSFWAHGHGWRLDLTLKGSDGTPARTRSHWPHRSPGNSACHARSSPGTSGT